MKTDELPTVVIFRKWRAFPHDVFALFPYLVEHNGDCDSYCSVGGHGSANYHLGINASRPADPEEYAETKEILERNYGYRLTIRKRCNRATWRAAYDKLRKEMMQHAT